ncbi:MAG: hypothetical protein M3Q56_09720 [Bacteroidota bacterium]|nr:hypothetical protein [Bacteroidota bacterium]
MKYFPVKIGMNYISYMLILSCVTTGLLNAQNDKIIKKVKSQFQETEKNIWTEEFIGQSLEGNKLRLIICHSLTEYKALLQETNKTFEWYFEGEYTPDNLMLIILDSLQNRLGSCTGVATDSTIVMECMDQLKSHGRYYFLKKKSESNESIVSCFPNIWLRKYSGTFKNQPVVLTLKRTEDDRILGTLDHESLQESFNFNGTCKVGTCEDVIIAVSNFLHPKYGTLLLDLSNAFGSFLEGSIGEEKSIKLSLEMVQDIRLICRNFYKNNITLQTQTFLTNHKILDKWVNDQILTLVNSLPDSNTVINPLPYKIYMELDYWNDDLLSGYLQLQNFPDTLPNIIPFNFNLQSGRFIDLEDFFLKDIDFNIVLQEIIELKKLERQDQVSKKEKEFIGQSSFPHYTIKPGGLYFSANFSKIYGFSRILIPFRRLEGYLDKNGPVKRI